MSFSRIVSIVSLGVILGGCAAEAGDSSENVDVSGSEVTSANTFVVGQKFVIEGTLALRPHFSCGYDAPCVRPPAEPLGATRAVVTVTRTFRGSLDECCYQSVQFNKFEADVRIESPSLDGSGPRVIEARSVPFEVGYFDSPYGAPLHRFTDRASGISVYINNAWQSGSVRGNLGLGARGTIENTTTSFQNLRP